MSLGFQLPTLAAFRATSLRQRNLAVALRRAAREAAVRAKEIYPSVLVLATFGVLLATTLALRVLVWLPRFYFNH
jgi:hypothetical protein